MTLFKKRTYTWSELGAFKLSLLCIGIAIGLIWDQQLLPYVSAFAGVGAILALYIVLVSTKK